MANSFLCVSNIMWSFNIILLILYLLIEKATEVYTIWHPLIHLTRQGEHFWYGIKDIWLFFINVTFLLKSFGNDIKIFSLHNLLLKIMLRHQRDWRSWDTIMFGSFLSRKAGKLQKLKIFFPLTSLCPTRFVKIPRIIWLEGNPKKQTELTKSQWG